MIRYLYVTKMAWLIVGIFTIYLDQLLFLSKSIFYDHTKHLYLSWITSRGSNTTNKGIFKEFCYMIRLFMILKRIQFMKYLHMHVIIYMRLISKKKHMLSFVLVKAFCIFPLWYFSKKTRSCKIEICYSFRDNGINVSLFVHAYLSSFHLCHNWIYKRAK